MVMIEPIRGVRGEVSLPGDKSITHRSFIFSSIAEGYSLIKNPNTGDDVLRTLEIMQKIGAEVSFEDKAIKIRGVGISGIKEPDDVLNAGNSGTTIRLLSGLFSGVKGKFFVITGDSSLRKRPMKRIVEPINLMGGFITGRENGRFPPLVIIGRKLKGIEYEPERPSAQVKSALILAGLNAQGKTTILEKVKTRDHTERMLEAFGGKILSEDKRITVFPVEKLYGREIFIPGDFSSASYFIVLTLLLDNSELVIKNVSLNPTRIYLLHVLRRGGANIRILNEKVKNGEIFGDVYVKSSSLSKIYISRDEAPLLIDELPLIGIMGAFLEEGVKVEGAEELRVKESDRIRLVVENLRNLGVFAHEFPDGFYVKRGEIRRGVVKTGFDHRITLSFSILGLLSRSGIYLEEIDSIKVSFPGFFEIVRRISYG